MSEKKIVRADCVASAERYRSVLVANNKLPEDAIFMLQYGSALNGISWDLFWRMARNPGALARVPGAEQLQLARTTREAWLVLQSLSSGYNLARSSYHVVR